MEQNQYEIYHAGVKGMKWGVRKAKPKTSSGRTKRVSSSDAAYVDAYKQKQERAKRIRSRGATAAAASIGVIGGATVATAAALYLAPVITVFGIAKIFDALTW